jgi:hypothetical protein
MKMQGADEDGLVLEWTFMKVWATNAVAMRPCTLVILRSTTFRAKMGTRVKQDAFAAMDLKVGWNR